MDKERLALLEYAEAMKPKPTPTLVPYVAPVGDCYAAARQFTDWDLATADRIITRESRGRSWVIGGPNYNGSYDHGCFQINMPTHTGKLVQVTGSSDVRLLLDPIINARVAHLVWIAGGGWFPWATY